MIISPYSSVMLQKNLNGDKEPKLNKHTESCCRLYLIWCCRINAAHCWYHDWCYQCKVYMMEGGQFVLVYVREHYKSVSLWVFCFFCVCEGPYVRSGRSCQIVCGPWCWVCVTLCSCLSTLELNLCDENAANTVTSMRMMSNVVQIHEYMVVFFKMHFLLHQPARSADLYWL